MSKEQNSFLDTGEGLRGLAARESLGEAPKQKERHDWFVVTSGRKFHPLDPVLADIDILDVAASLARQCRFAGHVKLNPYSVAQHSVLVSFLLPAHLALVGLLHDAAEAYVQDMIRPIKHSPEMRVYREVIEDRMERAICQVFGLPFPLPREVKTADNRILMTERRDLIRPHSWDWFAKDFEPAAEEILPLLPEHAEELFLRRYAQLTGKELPWDELEEKWLAMKLERVRAEGHFRELLRKCGG